MVEMWNLGHPSLDRGRVAQTNKQKKTFFNGIWVQERRPQSENWAGDLLLFQSNRQDVCRGAKEC